MYRFFHEEKHSFLLDIPTKIDRIILHYTASVTSVDTAKHVSKVVYQLTFPPAGVKCLVLFCIYVNICYCLSVLATVMWMQNNLFFKLTFNFWIMIALQKSCKDTTKSSHILFTQLPLMLISEKPVFLKKKWSTLNPLVLPWILQATRKSGAFPYE